MERFKHKYLGGVGIWTFLTVIFFIGNNLSENLTLVTLMGYIMLTYRTTWARRTLWWSQSPILKWIYEATGADWIVQQISVTYILELIFLFFHKEDFIKRYIIAYICHTFSFIYIVYHLPTWKLNFLYRYIYWSTITSSTVVIGMFTGLTLVQFKIFGFILYKKSENDDDSLNYLSLDSGFLFRFFTLFSIQAMAYYKSDIDNQILFHHAIKSRRFA